MQQPYDEEILQTTPAPDGGQAGGLSVGAGSYQGAALWPCLCSLLGKLALPISHVSPFVFRTTLSLSLFFLAHASISHLSLFSPAFLLVPLPTFSWRTYPTSHDGKRDPPRAPVHLRRANFDGLTLTVTAHSNNDETVWSNNKFKHNNLISILSQATPV